MKKRRLLALLLISTALLVGCSSEDANKDEDEDEKQVEKDSKDENEGDNDKNNEDENNSDNEDDEPKESPLDDFEWEIADNGIKITLYKGNDKEVIIPSVIDNRMVTEVADSAFAGNMTIEKIVMSKYLDDPDHDFSNCPSLTYLEYPSEDFICVSVKCPTLKTLSIPNGGRGATDTPALENLYLPKATYVNIESLTKLRNLKSVDLSSIEEIFIGQYNSNTEYTLIEYTNDFPQNLQEVKLPEALLNGYCIRTRYAIIVTPDEVQKYHDTYNGNGSYDPGIKITDEIREEVIFTAFPVDSITVNGVLYTK